VAEQGKKTMHVRLDQVGAAAFGATAGSGGKLVVDGAPEIGGTGAGMRPMELLLASVASCSAMDVLHILRKQKEPIEHLAIDIEGARAEGPVTPFTAMKMVFVARGNVDPHKLERAVALAVEKYCSARATLGSGVEVTWEARLEPRTVTRISATEAFAKMGEGYVYVDVRREDEFADSHPAGSLNVPWQIRGAAGNEANPAFIQVMEKLFAKDARLVIGCRSGNRSLKAAADLAAAGFTNLLEQRAGMIGVKDATGQLVEPGWPGAGLPTGTGAPVNRSYADLKQK
jgi:putative redox protein